MSIRIHQIRRPVYPNQSRQAQEFANDLSVQERQEQFIKETMAKSVSEDAGELLDEIENLLHDLGFIALEESTD